MASCLIALKTVSRGFGGGRPLAPSMDRTALQTDTWWRSQWINPLIVKKKKSITTLFISRGTKLALAGYCAEPPYVKHLPYFPDYGRGGPSQKLPYYHKPGNGRGGPSQKLPYPLKPGRGGPIPKLPYYPPKPGRKPRPGVRENPRGDKMKGMLWVSRLEIGSLGHDPPRGDSADWATGRGVASLAPANPHSARVIGHSPISLFHP
ncbi:unnamed protein product [Chilo suppressalis]|uniref:Uncharacterized protein n=1 Tax=Chilo suppressalis TaxID=168631 RepID=A0ABN8B3F5_CHISP|nr:unnamed protein product [Chilo suppressalis]